jgi:glycosyltransferase involved in cell wall biosynthesis
MYVLGAFPVLSETFIANEIRAMRALGHRVVPLALGSYDGACQPEDEVFRSETLALSAISAGHALFAAATRRGNRRSAVQFATRQKGLAPRSLLLAGARVAQAARQHGCSHLHAHFALPAAATAIVAGKLAGLTASFMAHGYDVYGTPADLALKLAAADFAIASCEDMREDFLRLAPTAKVRLVSCGVDPARFRPVPGMARNGRLLAVGRLVEQKGYDVLLAALAALPADVRPTIDAVGGGELAEQLARDAAALGVAASIRFLGPRPAGWIAAEGPAYLGFVAPYCITANGDRDTGPLVVREAMAMGLPVVASALMGMKETITPECGRHVPPRDVAALAAALQWLVALPEDQRVKMGEAGRRRVEASFTISDQAAGLAAAIRSVQP